MELTKSQIQTLKSLAIDSANKKNLPNAALMLDGNKIVESEGSYPASTPDATAHSERVVITNVCKRIGKFLLPATYSIVSIFEPCLMCIGAAYWAGIKKIYYIIPASKYVDKIPWATESKTIDKHKLIAQFNEKMEIIKLDKYEKEFTALFDEYVKKIVRRE